MAANPIITQMQNVIDKKFLAKTKKDAREKKKTEAKEKKKAEAEAAKAKKGDEAEVAKKKKKVEAKTMAWKKIEDRAAKNVKTSLYKKQTNKHKTTLSNNSISKKKQRKMEDIAKTESKPNP